MIFLGVMRPGLSLGSSQLMEVVLTTAGIVEAGSQRVSSRYLQESPNGVTEAVKCFCALQLFGATRQSEVFLRQKGNDAACKPNQQTQCPAPAILGGLDCRTSDCKIQSAYSTRPEWRNGKTGRCVPQTPQCE